METGGVDPADEDAGVDELLCEAWDVAPGDPEAVDDRGVEEPVADDWDAATGDVEDGATRGVDARDTDGPQPAVSVSSVATEINRTLRRCNASPPMRMQRCWGAWVPPTISRPGNRWQFRASGPLSLLGRNACDRPP